MPEGHPTVACARRGRQTGEGMKLSPLDIQHMEFKAALNGYNRKQVREFLEDVALEREELLRELRILRDQLDRKDQEIAGLKQAEDQLKRAVIAAERIGGELKESARREAELTIREAESLKEDIVREAEGRLKEARREVGRLEHQQLMFREQFRGLLQAYERTLDAPPAGGQPDTPPGRAKSAARAGEPAPPQPPARPEPR